MFFASSTASLWAATNPDISLTAVSISLHYIMGIDFLVALTLGSIVGGTTGAVVIPIARKMRIAERTKTMLVMESVMTDVLVIVATLSLISVIKLDEFSVWDVIYELSMKFIVGLPMKPATKRLIGFRYTSRGVPICCTSPE